jgi:hypothetical protein
VEINYNGTEFFKANLLVNQFGVVATAPLHKGKAIFHPESGGIQNLELTGPE